MRLLLTTALLAAALSGCLSEPRGDDAGAGGGDALLPPPGVLRLDAAGVQSDGRALLWAGTELVGPPVDETSFTQWFVGIPDGACDDGQCESTPFTVGEAPPGWTLAVTVEWEGQDEDYTTASGYLGSPALFMDLTVLRDGQVVAEGRESGHYASVALLPDPAPGTYEAHVRAVHGTGTYQGAVALQPTSPQWPAGDVLPDLVMLPPDHLRVAHPLAREASPALSVVQRGCGPDEAAEDQHLRCLRYAGIVGNQGPGAFEVVLEYGEAVGSAAGDGRWMQRVFQADGGDRLEPVAPAQYHAVHGHFHILGLVETRLHAVDEATWERTAEHGDGRKTGFCLIDGGLIDQRAPAVPPAYFGAGCCYYVAFCQLDMATNERFHMGIGAGWYDIYPWYRADQYVEITGLPDGVYELESRVNPEGTLFEADTGNNAASTFFRLSGDDVEMLEQRTEARVGPHPDADW